VNKKTTNLTESSFGDKQDNEGFDGRQLCLFINVTNVSWKPCWGLLKEGSPLLQAGTPCHPGKVLLVHPKGQICDAC